MRRYETIVIVDPDVGDEQRGLVLDRIKELIPQQNGILVKIDTWGTKKLAYEIKKKMRGFYARVDYCGSGPLVDEIERFFKIDDRVLKFMTVMLAQTVDPAQIQEEIAKAAAQQEPAAPPVEAGPAPAPVETAEAEAKPADPEPATVENNKEES